MNKPTITESTIAKQNKTHVIIKRKIAKLIKFNTDLEEVIFDDYVDNDQIKTVLINI